MCEIGTTEAAQVLGVTPRRVQALIKTGRLNGIKKGRDWFITRADIEAFKKSPAGRPKTNGS